MKLPKSYKEKFLNRTEERNGCLVWKTHLDKDEYGEFQFRHNGEKVRVRAHRAAWFFTHGRWPKGVLRHTCNNPSCVRIEHLREGTHADNVRDRVDQDRSARGESNGRAKLTEDDILLIRREASTGHHSLCELGRMFGVDHAAIGAILRGKTWKHVGV